jgi:hypothetical protein
MMDHALADPAWLRERLQEVEEGRPLRAEGLCQLVMGGGEGGLPSGSRSSRGGPAGPWRGWADAPGTRRTVRAAQDPTLHHYDAYVPVGDVVAKLRRWQHQGAEIDYLSSDRNPEDVAKDAAVLGRYGFPPGRVLARQPGHSYGQVAARELPDVLIEDDCERIGVEQVTYPQIRPDLRGRTKSIVVPELGGIDHLPESLQDLLAFNSQKTQPPERGCGMSGCSMRPGSLLLMGAVAGGSARLTFLRRPALIRSVLA